MPGQRDADRDRCDEEYDRGPDRHGANSGHAAQFAEARQDAPARAGRRLARPMSDVPRRLDGRPLPVRLDRVRDSHGQLTNQRPDRDSAQPGRKHFDTSAAIKRRTGS
jgi:hypothetical protein